MIAQPDLSSPPSTVVPSLRMTSPSTIGWTPSPGITVSMCAERRSGAAATVPGTRASTLPVVPPTLVPASSTQISAPRSRSSRASRSAMPCSFREWLSMRTSSRKRAVRRSREMPLVATGGTLYTRRRASKPAPKRRMPAILTGRRHRVGWWWSGGCEAAQSLMMKFGSVEQGRCQRGLGTVAAS